MTENEVNLAVKKWLVSNGYKYKGVLNSKNDTSRQFKGTKVNPSQPSHQDNSSTSQVLSQVPVPLPYGERLILIDHQGVKDRPVDLIWVEAKGEVGISQLLEGFIRVTCACYWGGGNGLLAIPSAECDKMLEQREFLKRVGVSCERKIGILDAEKKEVHWLT